MSTIGFVIKTAVMTVILVLIMQVRWGNETIEDHVMTFVSSATVMTPLNQTAQSAVRFFRNMWNKANHSFDTHFSRSIQDENRPGNRHLNFSIERSEKVVKQKAEEVEDAAKGAYEEAKESSVFQKFKDKASSATARIRSKLSDETESTSPSSVKATSLDE